MDGCEEGVKKRLEVVVVAVVASSVDILKFADDNRRQENPKQL